MQGARHNTLVRVYEVVEDGSKGLMESHDVHCDTRPVQKRSVNRLVILEVQGDIRYKQPNSIFHNNYMFLGLVRPKGNVQR